MGETKHTPGPWDLCEAHPCSHGARVLAGCRIIATVVGGIGRRATKSGRANARLIAAAPDLLEALRAVEWSGESHDEDGDPVDACPWCGSVVGDAHDAKCKVAAAIAKAEGRGT